MAKRKPVGWRKQPARHRAAALKGKMGKVPRRRYSRQLDGATFTRSMFSYSKRQSQRDAAAMRERGLNARVIPGSDGRGHRIYIVYKRIKPRKFHKR